MAINEKELMKIGTFGAAAGLATPVILKYAVMPVLNMIGGLIPTLSAKLAEQGSVTIAVRESLTGINGGLAGWIIDATGLSITVPFQTYIMAAIGGAVFFIVGAYAADMLGFLKGNAVGKTRAVIFTGSIISGFVLGGFAVPELGLSMVNMLIAMLINAAILAWVYVTIDEKAGLNLIPF